VSAAEIEERSLLPFFGQRFQFTAEDGPVPVVVPTGRYPVKNIPEIVCHFGSTVLRVIAQAFMRVKIVNL
jgi:hypothetical protein